MIWLSEFSELHFFLPGSKFTDFSDVFVAKFHVTLKKFPEVWMNNYVAFFEKKIENKNSIKIVKKFCPIYAENSVNMYAEKLTNSFHIERKKNLIIW